MGMIRHVSDKHKDLWCSFMYGDEKISVEAYCDRLKNTDVVSLEYLDS